MVIYMRKIPCLNFSKRMEEDDPEKENFFSSTISECIKESGYTSFQRVYVGSSFCSQYFLSITANMMRQIRSYCESFMIKITLVIPIVTQKNLNKVKEKLYELVYIAGDCLDEITVNDFGMLLFIDENYVKSINLGRLFMKDYRERRYEEYFHSCLQPKIMNPVMMDFIKSYRVTGFEFDPTHREMDFIHIPSEMTVGIHYPYCYQTVGHICEVGSIHVPLEQKFRPSHPCQLECEKVTLSYQAAEGMHYYKKGRAVFFENTECNIINRKEIRLIYTPKLIGGEHT